MRAPGAAAAQAIGDAYGQQSSGAQDCTLVRSWLAISLVGGRVIFTAVSFWIGDTTLRSALVGGRVRDTGARWSGGAGQRPADLAAAREPVSEEILLR